MDSRAPGTGIDGAGRVWSRVWTERDVEEGMHGARKSAYMYSKELNFKQSVRAPIPYIQVLFVVEAGRYPANERRKKENAKAWISGNSKCPHNHVRRTQRCAGLEHH